MPQASRGEVWIANLDPTTGHEQAKQRPVLVLSNDVLNHGAGEMLVILPITSVDKGIPLHVEVIPPEGGLSRRSFVMCDQIRAISTRRLRTRGPLGTLSPETMSEVADRVKIVLDLD